MSGSRHKPQFNKEARRKSLRNCAIGYEHVEVFSGLRHVLAESANMDWRNAPFRGSADGMQTPESAEAIAETFALPSEKPTAVICTEAVP